MPTLESSPKATLGAASPRQTPFAVAQPGRVSDPRWQLALRIAATSLGRSRLMVDFLLYIVDRHIDDRCDEITEQRIGVLVFGRPEGYDTNEDNIVRSYARNLRKRIEEYFAKEGADEPLLLEIPRGGYTPIFSSRTADSGQAPDDSVEVHDHEHRLEQKEGAPDASLLTEDTPAVEQTQESVSKTATVRSRSLRKAIPTSAILTLSAGLILGALVASFFPRIWLRRIITSSAEGESRALWSQLFSRKTDTFIVPSDDGLVIMQRLTPRPVPLASYVNGSYRESTQTKGDPGAAEIVKLGSRRFTSMVDLDFVSRLSQLSEVVPERMVLRYARDLRMDDLRDGNAILIGSVEANPWLELFQPQMNFRFSIHANSNQPSGIVNTHPRTGEGLIYSSSNQNRTYGLIAYLPNLNATGHVLIVGGLNTAGTQAAETFLLTPSLMKAALQRARLPGGGLQPFELLIGSGNIASNASAPKLVLERIGPS